MTNLITYFFEDKEIRKAFKKCVNVICDELSTARAMNLNEICTISKVPHSEEEFEDGEILVDISNLKECIEFFIEHFKIDARSLYLNDETITNRINFYIDNPEEFIDKDLDFSLTFEKNSNLDALFNILFSGIKSLDLCGDHYEINYEQFDYAEITDAIEEIIEQKFEKIEEYDFRGISGDANDNNSHVDINYELKIKDTLEDKICEIADKCQKESDFYLNDTTYDIFISELVYSYNNGGLEDLEKEVKMCIDNLKLEYGNKKDNQKKLRSNQQLLIERLKKK